MQYVIGIDLGTTNSVLAYAPIASEGAAEGEAEGTADEGPLSIELLPITQLIDNSTVDQRSSLPSFTYLASDAETEGGAMDLPWSSGRAFAVGELARRRSAEAPDRTVGASKSWLCNGDVDRRAPILPFGAPDDVAKISPVTAAREYLQHLVDGWHAAFPDSPIRDQQVILTVPASFDPVARELTREAAIAAGLGEDFLFLEEPQAALYAWLHRQGETWRKTLKVDDRVLVCDVGGGTTDLTLIRVADEGGDLVLERTAVGDHLLVGGDNMDLAAAYFVSEKFSQQGTTLNPWQSVALWHACRAAKETLLSEGGPDSHPVSIAGRGSKLIASTISVDVDRGELASMLKDGFFPSCQMSDMPQRQPASGFQEIGLPYESDPGITRHIAEFVRKHCRSDDGSDSITLPQYILFNGGVFRADGFRDQLLSVINSWSEQPDAVKTIAGGGDLDFAVATGACFYGSNKRQGGMRIRGGVGSSYYVGIETAGLAIPGAPRPLKALCVVPFGMEEGTELPVESNPVGLVVGQPVSFRFFSSKTRKEDRPGQLIGSWTEDDMTETDPLATTLTVDGSDEQFVPVRFESRITELGMFELWCVSAKPDEHEPRKWKLEFNVRDEA